MFLTGRGIPEISKLRSYKCGELATYTRVALTEHEKCNYSKGKLLLERKG